MTAICPAGPPKLSSAIFSQTRNATPKPMYSDFILIEPSRKLMTPAAALFASVLKAEAQRSTELFRTRVASQLGA